MWRSALVFFWSLVAVAAVACASPAPSTRTAATVTLAVPDSAFPGDAVTATWDGAPEHAYLFWTRSSETDIVGDGGWTEGATGSKSVRVPSDYGRFTLRLTTSCTFSSLGPLTSSFCGETLASDLLDAARPRMAVTPAPAYAGEPAVVTYENAPVNAQIRLVHGPEGLIPAESSILLGTVVGSSAGYDPAVRASGRVTFTPNDDHHWLRIEMRPPCADPCEILPGLPHPVLATTDFSLAGLPLTVTPEAARPGQTVEFGWSHAPAAGVLATHGAFPGFGTYVATTSGTEGRVRFVIPAEWGEDCFLGRCSPAPTHGKRIWLHATCAFGHLLSYDTSSCSEALASVTVTILGEEPEVIASPSPSARPTIAVAGAPSLGPAAAFSAAPSVGPSPSVPGVTPPPSPTPSGDPLASAPLPLAPTIAPSAAPTVVTTSAPTLVPTRAPTLAPTVAPTAAPTATPVPTQAQTPAPTPTPQPTPVPNSAPVITQLPDQQGKPTQSFVFTITASDAEKDAIRLTCSGGDSFKDGGNGTGTLSFRVPDSAKSGQAFTFTCTATDARGAVSKPMSFSIKVA